jgi:hypothetical protein
MKKLMLYVKMSDMTHFAPMDLKNNRIAENVLFATLIPESRLEKLKTAITAESKQTGNAYYIKIAGTNKILFRTDK